jgi:hypothetical protein
MDPKNVDLRMKLFAILLAFSLAAALPSAALAQSLAEVAKREEARRKAVKVPGKVYTNSDLKPDPSKESVPERLPDSLAGKPTPTPVAGKPAPEPTRLAAGGTAEPVAPPANEGEAYWKGLITSARTALERSTVLADALQSRLNALATDIVNRDDPAQRAQLELERQRALAELDRMKAQIADQTKAIADIEEDARKAGVPPGWLR